MRSRLLLCLLPWALLGCKEKEPPQPAPPSTLSYVELVRGDPHDALPMVVAVHGLGDTPENFAKLFGLYQEPIRIILPRAPLPYHHGFSWFDIYKGLDDQKLYQGVSDAAAQLEGLLEELPRRYKIKGKPMLTGFSQGGMLSFMVATHRPDLIAEAIPISGFLPDGLRPAMRTKETVPIYAQHGVDDDTVPFSRVEDTVTFLQALGFDVTLRSYPGVKHQISGEIRETLFSLLRHPGTAPVSMPAPR